jgi:hypothetical protein
MYIFSPIVSASNKNAIAFLRSGASVASGAERSEIIVEFYSKSVQRNTILVERSERSERSGADRSGASEASGAERSERSERSGHNTLQLHLSFPFFSHICVSNK